MPSLLCDDMPAGACAADVEKIDFKKVQAEVEADKTAKEIELFHHIKTYVILLNKEASIEQSKLYISASAYECTLDSFNIVIYAAKKWKNFLLDGLGKYIEEKYQEIIDGWTIPCEYMAIEVIPGLLYSFKYYIRSTHAQKENLHMYYHNAE